MQIEVRGGRGVVSEFVQKRQLYAQEYFSFKRMQSDSACVYVCNDNCTVHACMQLKLPRGVYIGINHM